MNKQHFDFIILGAGVSGLMLADKLVQHYGNNKSILLIDKQIPSLNSKNICFWTESALGFDEIINKKWNNILYKDISTEQKKSCDKYSYYHLKGMDLYNLITKRIQNDGNVKILKANIDGVTDKTIKIQEKAYVSEFIFDSRFDSKKFIPGPKCFQTKQYILGWTIKTDINCFAEDTVTFLDIHTTKNGLEFFYILPFTKKTALVECVQYFEGDLGVSLQDYIEEKLKITSYNILEKEQGITTLTDCKFERIDSNGVIKIGTAGGQVKPSTGYSLIRIIEDTDKIVSSIEKHAKFRNDNSFYKLCDSIFLYLMIYNHQFLIHMYKLMFIRFSIDEVFRFLDQKNTTLGNLIFLLKFYPYQIFLKLLLLIKIKAIA